MKRGDNVMSGRNVWLIWDRMAQAYLMKVHGGFGEGFSVATTTLPFNAARYGTRREAIAAVSRPHGELCGWSSRHQDLHFHCFKHETKMERL